MLETKENDKEKRKIQKAVEVSEDDKKLWDTMKTVKVEENDNFEDKKTTLTHQEKKINRDRDKYKVDIPETTRKSQESEKESESRTAGISDKRMDVDGEDKNLDNIRKTLESQSGNT